MMGREVRYEATTTRVYRRHGLPSKVHSSKVPNQDGIELLLKAPSERLPHLSYLRTDAGCQGRSKQCVEQELRLRIEFMHRTPKPIWYKIARILAEEWAKEGQELDWQLIA